MSTATATPPTIEASPQIGGSVLVSYYDGQHVLRNTPAFVLAIGPSDENGLPVLSVAFPSLPPDPRKLSGPRWNEGFERRTSVVHYTHPDAVAGRESIVWGYAAREADFPALVTPPGDGKNPIFERHVLEQVAPDIAQVSAVQHGKAPQGVSAPVLTSEAGSPSAADLDAHAAEQSAKEATSATGPAETQDATEPGAAPAHPQL